ncbi:hypothetical protein SAMN02745216_04754 [Desulfatibacillum alkenivorans DSM 16219]|uniref:Thioredoxin-like [2Fe-2S] ferredoxin n=1 Tax=Desulfatibacillum alkenivorans DSM 16219 TaxID=1121393 RepID=A0A1M6YHB0_9BACT|nr:hypothetical protein [Desulfatibacillum alkenivorans]SHL17510.1 hypothetical protein SAMN02745216_04754 [Desulfatibacillum alkenivorans DSM 16219]
MVFVGLKYCGGCTPRYDRVEFVSRLKEKIAKHVRLVSYDDPRAEHVLVVVGCESACAETEPFKDKTVHLASQEEDLERMAETLIMLDNGNNT